MEIDVASLPPENSNEARGDLPTPIAWDGGDCPVPANTLVQVQCVFEAKIGFDHTQPPRMAKAWERRWNRDFGDKCGITHYVIVAEPRLAGGVS
jgi:hypothetical protein